MDSRPYIQRLNLVAPDWQDEYQITMLADRVVVLCRLTVNGVTRTGDGECLLASGEDENGRAEPNAVTTASAQAFKRACVKFGLGAYLYALPQTWCNYDHARRKIVNPPQLPDWALPWEERRTRQTPPTPVDGGVEREARLNPVLDVDRVLSELGFEPDPSPAQAEPVPADPGQTVIHFGRYKDKTLSEVWALGKEGQGWVRWCADQHDTHNQAENIHLQRMARAFLAANASYAG